MNRSHILTARRPDPATTAARLRKLLPARPVLGVVLGSGWGTLGAGLQVVAQVPYSRLPGFPRTRVAGHEGWLRLGRVGTGTVLLLSGRAHFYEGHTLEAVTFPVRVLAEFGIRDLLLTNAAGGIRRGFCPGDFMRIRDHINLMGANPLRGPSAEGRDRFVDLTQTYDRGLARLLERAARQVRLRLRSGVYLAVSGPSFETPAEIRAFARWGADAVGMSTVPEAIVARQCGLRVAGLSCITNLAAGRSPRPLAHAEVLAAGKRVADAAARLLRRFLELYFLSESTLPARP